MIRAIINADDFGLCRGVNEGIIRAHREGILTSATLMANMPGFEQALDLSRANPRLGVGLHLNIVRGEPVSPREKVPSLLGPSGLFLGSVYVFLRRLLAGRILLGEVERELRAQAEKALGAGFALTHLDSEKHMHTVPPIFTLALRLGKEYGIPGVRFINEFCLSPNLIQSGKSWLISLSCFFMKKRIREHGIITADGFYGICRSGRMTAGRLRKVLSRLGEGATEIMTHPGYMTQELLDLEKITGSYYINNFREAELEALCDGSLGEVIRSRRIQLITFREL